MANLLAVQESNSISGGNRNMRRGMSPTDPLSAHTNAQSNASIYQPTIGTSPSMRIPYREQHRKDKLSIATDVIAGK